MQKKFSNKEIEEKFKHLLLKGWNLSEDKIYIQKTFVFKNFKEAFCWMCRIAFIAEEINHHPNWTNVFKTVDISLSLIHISEPTRHAQISYAVFCLKKKKT